jgi:NADH-quinone oxidoreductase subunit F
MNWLSSFDELSRYRLRLTAERSDLRPTLTVCMSTGCTASGSEAVLRALVEAQRKLGAEGRVTIRRTGCHGFCERGPLVVLRPHGLLYQQVEEKDAEAIVASIIDGVRPVERLLYQDPVTGVRVAREEQIPFYQKQTRLLLANNGHIDPTDIGDYVAVGGYSALEKVLSSMKPEEVIGAVKRAGLRGRGGAGFPTGRKWELCRSSEGWPKYVICNADEGDPGAFMDRSLLEANPHSVLEGLLIGAYAIGADEGYFYIRNEYPLALRHVRTAIQQASESGLLGENILGSGFSFSVKVCRGGGAFVCGEETALIASVEGRLGEPRPRPPYPVERGLWGKPTDINNVKTWASVPLIINNGPEWFANIGTEQSKGTMIFSLVGKVCNTGLVEVPMGITLRRLIFDIGGGPPPGRSFKAVQAGGPSGGCLPASLLDLQVDYEQLAAAGSMMGSGGMVVMDDRTCMVNVAKYFLTFTADESCGKCVPCREGTKEMLAILTDITEGRGSNGELEKLEEIAHWVKDTALCGLGQTAPNPVLTTLRYFRDEYVAHTEQHRCPAGVCRALIRYYIEPSECPGCGLCRLNCPSAAITGDKQKPHVIDAARCERCGVCIELCKFGAIKVE